MGKSKRNKQGVTSTIAGAMPSGYYEEAKQTMTRNVTERMYEAHKKQEGMTEKSDTPDVIPKGVTSEQHPAPDKALPDKLVDAMLSGDVALADKCADEILGKRGKDKAELNKEFWTAHGELSKTIEALNAAANLKTIALANTIFEAQRLREQREADNGST